LQLADLRGADLRGAHLTGAQLGYTNLIGINPTELDDSANLDGALIFESPYPHVQQMPEDLRAAWEARLPRGWRLEDQDSDGHVFIRARTTLR
jgi:uncharacterized protein YjbI with pentapeptide repeats